MATKFGLRGAIFAMTKATLRTSLRRISGVHKDNRHTVKACLVSDVLVQQSISPEVILVALVPSHSNRCPCPNALKVFKGDAKGKCLCVRNDTLCDCVHDRASVVSKPFGKAFKGTPHASVTFSQPTLLRLLSLQLTPKFLHVLSLFNQFLTAIEVSEAVGSDVSDADIHSKPTFRVYHFFFRQIGSDGDEEGVSIPAVNQLSMSTTETDAGKKIAPKDDRHDDATFDGGDRNTVNALKGKQALVKVNGREFKKFNGLIKPTFLGQGFVGVADTGNNPNGILGRQSVGQSY